MYTTRELTFHPIIFVPVDFGFGTKAFSSGTGVPVGKTNSLVLVVTVSGTRGCFVPVGNTNQDQRPPL